MPRRIKKLTYHKSSFCHVILETGLSKVWSLFVLFFSQLSHFVVTDQILHFSVTVIYDLSIYYAFKSS